MGDRSVRKPRRRPGGVVLARRSAAAKPRPDTSARPAAKPLSLAETGERSRAALIETGLELFARKGFHGTSIRDIAYELGISVSTLYHHFAGKEGLWLAILDHEIARIPERLEEALCDVVEPLARFRRLVETHLSLSARHPRELVMLLSQIEQPTRASDKVHRDLQRRVLTIYVREIEGLRATGRLPAEPAKFLAFNVLGVINWQLRWLRTDGSVSVAEAHQSIADFILRGVLGDAAKR